MTDIRRHLTDLMSGELKRQVKTREAGGWERVHWDLVCARPRANRSFLGEAAPDGVRI